jgi:hypothetical protein
MIARKGQTVSLAGITSSTYAPATGIATPTAYTASGDAVLLPLSPYRKAGNTSIIDGDEQMLLAGVNGAALTEPPVNTVVTLADDTKYTLVAVEPLRPAGLNIMFDCIVRGQQ